MCARAAVQLKEAGFTELKEDDEWMPGKKSTEGSLRKVHTHTHHPRELAEKTSAGC